MLSFLVEDDGLSRSQRQDVSAIQLCAFNMQRLVNDVLDLAKLREGTLVLRPVQVWVRALHSGRGNVHRPAWM